MSLTRPRGGRVRPERLTQQQRDLLMEVRAVCGSACFPVAYLRERGTWVAVRYGDLSAALRRLHARGYLDPCGRGRWRVRPSQERKREPR